MKKRNLQKYDVGKSIKIKIDSQIGFKDSLALVIRFAEENPDVIYKLSEILTKNNGKFPRSFGCPFPEDCDQFPCNAMGCNADECSNGYAFRRS